jgi:hypothetical protein
MITIKIGELAGLLAGFAEIMTQRIPVRLAYQISNITKRLTDEYQSYEKLRQKLCLDYCEKDADGQPIIVDKKYSGLDKDPDFITELNQLLSMPVEIDYEPITITELSAAGVCLSGQDIIALGQFVKEG